MTTSALSMRFMDDESSALPRAWGAGQKLPMVLVTLAFLCSILQYRVERNDAVRLVPVSLVSAASVLLLVRSPRDRRRAIFTGVMRPATIALIVLGSFPPLISSLYRTSNYPLQYGIATVVTLLAARILLTEIGLDGLLLCFFWGTTLGMMMVVGTTIPELLAASGSTRYAPLYLDPNRTGLFAVTSIPAQLWFAMRGKANKLALVAAIMCVWVIVAASSRGSAGALLIAAGFTIPLYLVKKMTWRSGLALSRNKLAIALMSLCVVTGAAIAQQPALEHAGNYLSTKLELGSRARGLDSGFTGRTRGWAAVLDILPKTSWLYGNGYRTTDEDFNFSVDNGYLSGIYELGMVATVIIVSKYLVVAVFLSWAFLKSRSETATVPLALVVTLVIFLANAYVHRILFGSGDSASLLVLFLFVSNRQDTFDSIERVALNQLGSHENEYPSRH